MNNKKRIHMAMPPVSVQRVEDVCKIVIPKSEDEWNKLSKLKKIDMNDLACMFNAETILDFLDNTPTHVVSWAGSPFVSLGSLYDECPVLREEVITGLLRRGEIMNIVAAPKSKKSWLAGNIAMCCIGGGCIFDKPQFRCVKTGEKVLVIDNELHRETIAQRGRDFSEAMNVPQSVAGASIDYLCLRGGLIDIYQLEGLIANIRPNTYSIVILDALYRFYPEDFEENSNAAMARLYDRLDHYADRLNSAFICIHHTSKGSQASKSITDMGAGAGSQSRACDTHLAIQPHQEDGVYIIEAVTRSFKPVSSFCARFRWPVWHDEPNADPTLYAWMKRPKDADGAAGLGSWKDREMARIRTFFRDEVKTEMTRDQILTLGKPHKFSPWHKDRLTTLLPNLIKESVIREVKEKVGPIAATYIACTPTDPPAAQEPPKQAAQKDPEPDSAPVDVIDGEPVFEGDSEADELPF